MGTVLGDALARAGLVSKETADKAAKNIELLREKRHREVLESESRVKREKHSDEEDKVPSAWEHSS